MSKPNNFIFTTDFPTLKGDATVSVARIVGSSVTVNGNSFLSVYGDVTMGSIGALSRGRISSSKNSSIFYTGNNIAFTRTGTVLGSTTTYTVLAFMYRVSPTVLRFQIYIMNPYSDTLTCEAGADTITFYVNTFTAPYA